MFLLVLWQCVEWLFLIDFITLLSWNVRGCEIIFVEWSRIDCVIEAWALENPDAQRCSEWSGSVIIVMFIFIHSITQFINYLFICHGTSAARVSFFFFSQTHSTLPSQALDHEAKLSTAVKYVAARGSREPLDHCPWYAGACDQRCRDDPGFDDDLQTHEECKKSLANGPRNPVGGRQSTSIHKSRALSRIQVCMGVPGKVELVNMAASSTRAMYISFFFPFPLPCSILFYLSELRDCFFFFFFSTGKTEVHIFHQRVYASSQYVLW